MRVRGVFEMEVEKKSRIRFLPNQNTMNDNPGVLGGVEGVVTVLQSVRKCLINGDDWLCLEHLAGECWSLLVIAGRACLGARS